MSAKKTKSMRCPTCGKIVLAGAEDMPFCSARCRVIDLGKWVSGEYVISSPVVDPESGGEAEYTQVPRGRSPFRRELPHPDAGEDFGKPN